MYFARVFAMVVARYDWDWGNALGDGSNATRQPCFIGHVHAYSQARGILVGRRGCSRSPICRSNITNRHAPKEDAATPTGNEYEQPGNEGYTTYHLP